MKRWLPSSLVVLCFVSAGLHAQLPRPVVSVADDPSRPYPDFMRLYAQTRGFNLGRPSAARPMPDGKTVLFLGSLPTRPTLELHEFNVATGASRVLLTPDMLLKGAEESHSAEEKARRERLRITVGGFTSYEVSKDGRLILVPLSGKLYTFVLATGAVRELPVPAGTVLDAHLSPSGKHVAYVRDNNLCVMDLGTLKEKILTQGGSDAHTYGLAEFVAQEEMGRMRGFWWSPDDKTLLFEEADHTAVEEFFIQDPMHPENRPNAFRYPRAGKTNARVKLWTVPTTGGKPAAVTWDGERYPYLASVTWEENTPATLLVQTRDQKEEQLLALDVGTGHTHVLLTEKDDAWLNIDPEMPWWLKDGSGFLWRTERHGGHELELRGKDGALVRSVVPVASGLWDVAAVDDENVFFVGGATPLHNVLYRVPLDGGAPVQVSTSEGTRQVTFGKSTSVYVETRVSEQQFRVTEVFTAAGQRVGQLPSANMEPPFRPNVAFAKVGDGAGLYTVVIRPRAFVKGRRYPVVLQVYGGPRHNTVVGALDPYLREQWIADHGYIVVGVDGRGTQWRGRAWERAIAGDFSTLPLQDQVTGLKTLAQQIPEMDLSRVGVMGWSFGGYMAALAVLLRPDVFHSAVSGAPVVDWQDYDTHYTERYLGLVDQNAKGYNQSNLLSHAAQLSRPLLLIHGTADDNVYFFHTLKLSNALLRAGRAHNVLPLAGFTHMVPEPLMVERLWARMVDHLSETLHP